MKHKYCLVRTEGNLSPHDFVYVVWVGSSLRESTLLALVEEFCKDVGWYFKRWSATVDSALENRSKMFKSVTAVAARPYQTIAIDIEQCYQTIIDDAWFNLEANHTESQFGLWLRFRNTIAYHSAMNRRKCITKCPPSRRKNLSHKHSRGFYEMAAPMAFIVLLVVLDALVSRWLSTIL